MKVCNGHDTKYFKKFMDEDPDNLICPFCDAYPDCNKIFYPYSHTKSKLDISQWCSSVIFAILFLLSFLSNSKHNVYRFESKPFKDWSYPGKCQIQPQVFLQRICLQYIICLQEKQSWAWAWLLCRNHGKSSRGKHWVHTRRCNWVSHIYPAGNICVDRNWRPVQPLCRLQLSLPWRTPVLDTEIDICLMLAKRMIFTSESYK